MLDDQSSFSDTLDEDYNEETHNYSENECNVNVPKNQDISKSC